MFKKSVVKATLTVTSISLLSFTINQSIQAHGFTEYPKSRQNICKDDGGYWGENNDGSTIPNLACRAAYLHLDSDKERDYPFKQDHEVSAEIADYENIEAVKVQIPDGELCSAGDDRKDGLNIASPHWKKTEVIPDENGEITVHFNAKVPHRPNMFYFYISKPSFNADTDKLKWSDLELVANFGDKEEYHGSNNEQYYTFQVPIPNDRSGQALLFTRFQRVDSAGEGFYNCSDIYIERNGVTPNPDIWDSLGYVVTQGQVANVGDVARFRIFDENGDELIDENFLIDSTNINNWQQALATHITSFTDQIQIGVKDANLDITFDQANLSSNKIWSKYDQYSYQLTITSLDSAITPWQAGQSYNSGDKVTYNGAVYKAAWGSSDEPTQGIGSWHLEPGYSVEWQTYSVYQKDNVVIHNGARYKANWYNKNEAPGSGQGQGWSLL